MARYLASVLLKIVAISTLVGAAEAREDGPSDDLIEFLPFLEEHSGDAKLLATMAAQDPEKSLARVLDNNAVRTIVIGSVVSNGTVVAIYQNAIVINDFWKYTKISHTARHIRCPMSNETQATWENRLNFDHWGEGRTIQAEMHGQVVTKVVATKPASCFSCMGIVAGDVILSDPAHLHCSSWLAQPASVEIVRSGMLIRITSFGGI